jgi:hypothetical protein
LFHPTVLQFYRRKEEKWENKNHDTLAFPGKGSYVGIYIITSIDFSPLFSFILPWSISYGSFSQFKISIFFLVYRVNQPYSNS